MDDTSAAVSSHNIWRTVVRCRGCCSLTGNLTVLLCGIKLNESSPCAPERSAGCLTVLKTETGRQGKELGMGT
jgi:hypothetical protein